MSALSSSYDDHHNHMIIITSYDDHHIIMKQKGTNIMLANPVPDGAVRACGEIGDLGGNLYRTVKTFYKVVLCEKHFHQQLSSLMF